MKSMILALVLGEAAALFGQSVNGLQCAYYMDAPGTDTCTVTLSSTASSSVPIATSCSDSAVSFPGSTAVPAGSSSTTFTVSATAITAQRQAQINASGGGGTAAYTLMMVPKAGGGHQATLNWSNSSCTTGKACAIQVYRATCATSSTCPSYPSSSFAPLPSSTTTVTVNAGTASTAWKVVDADTNLADNTTYVWVATNSYQGSTNYSPPSSGWSGSTSGSMQIPVAPSLGTGNTIQ